MRRFFSRNKDSNGDGKASKEAEQFAAGAVDKGSVGVQTAKQFGQRVKGSADVAEPAAKHAPSSSHVPHPPGPATPAKQVAFAVKTVPATPESPSRPSQQEDVYSQASFHGRSSENIARSPAGFSCFPSSHITGARNASNPYDVQPLSPSMPSQPIRHASLDIRPAAKIRGRDATLRASQTPTFPVRGEIPRFQGNTTPLGQHQQRPGTSMSHDTSISTSSSYADARHAFYGSNRSTSNTGNAYYPNLAVLATYSRDMSAMNGANGQHSIMQHLTWSEITDEQLVENLGGRERTRQEVLFELVCSEERYIQELISLKENYLQPLLEHHCLSTAYLPTADTPAASNMRSISGPSPSLDVQPYQSATVKSTASLDNRRPFLSMSAGSASAKIRYATPVSTDHGHGALYSRASHRASEAHPAASTDHLPIAARFARRVSIDSPIVPDLNNVNQHLNNSSTNTAQTAVNEAPEAQVYARRDISGGSGGTGTTAVDSGDDTDYPSAKNYIQFGVLTGNGKSKSRLHPLFSNLGHATKSAGKGYLAANESTLSLNGPKTFKHHLKNLVPPAPNKLHKSSSPDLKGSNPCSGPAGPGWMVEDLPYDLKIINEVVANQILEGHRALSERLRARYEEQFPLVRTLADVFHDQAWMIEHYATYVMHLERALEEIEEILSLMNPLLASSKKVKSKDKEAVKEQKILAKVLMYLEEEAALKGAPGLSICLSQPFQRLLKYPLLFQSLLYQKSVNVQHLCHVLSAQADDDLLQLACEIDAIVRSIENEKASEEDRARTRDVWARIDGINDRALLSPRPDRLLVSESAMWSSYMTGGSAVAAARRTFSDASRTVDEAQIHTSVDNKKKTVRRLSDMTGMGGNNKDNGDKKKKQPSIGSKRDVWLVTFTDVVIRCQRVGVTKLPMQNVLDARGQAPLSMKDNRRRAVLLSNKERNLYKFSKIDHWIMADRTSPGRAGMINMADMARSRGVSNENRADSDSNDPATHSSASKGDEPTQQVNLETCEEAIIDMNGAESRMSFAYSNDEPRPILFDIDPLVGIASMESPLCDNPTSSVPARSVNAASNATKQALQKRGLATAKFSNRLRPSMAEANQSTLSARRAASPPLARHAPRSASATQDRERARGGFNKPTTASLAKASPPTSAFLTAGNRFPRPGNGRATPTNNTKRSRAASSNASPASARPSTSLAIPPSPRSPPKAVIRARRNSLPSSQGSIGAKQLRTKHSSEKLGQHGKFDSETDSPVALYR